MANVWVGERLVQWFFLLLLLHSEERTPYSIIRVMIIMAARLYVNFVRHNQHDIGTETNPYMKRYDFRRRLRRQATYMFASTPLNPNGRRQKNCNLLLPLFFSFVSVLIIFSMPLFVALGWFSQQTIITIFIHDKKRTTHDPTLPSHIAAVYKIC